jgi:type I restriction enzyme S subunit
VTAWSEVTLGDVIELKRGYDLPSAERIDGPHPIVSSSGVSGHHAEAKVKAPGVVTGRYGTLGRVFYITEDFWPLNTSLYVKDFKGNHPRFVAALLESLDLGQHDGAAAVPGLNRNQLHTLPVRVPDAAGQALLAGIFQALDDLIENNHRRVQVLQAMARAIYREWFVTFRYPGHEHVPLVETAIGPLPDGWAASTCGDELMVIGGGTPSKNENAYWNGGDIWWFTPSDLTKSRRRYATMPDTCITEEGLARSSARLFPAGSVLMTSRATLGVLAIATREASTNQGFIVVWPDDRWSPGFVYEWLDGHADALAAIATGATFKEITKGAFKRVPFVVPAQRVLDAHSEVTAPLETQIRVLEAEARNLTALRDILLPKLVTGQVDVSHLDLDALTEAAVP